MLDTSADSIYGLIKRRELESYLEDKRRKITVRSIERLIERRLAAATPEFAYSEPMRALRIKPKARGRREAKHNK